MSKQFNKTIGNINNLDDYSCQNATIQNLTVSNIIDSVFVSSSNNLTSNNIIIGDTGSKTIKTTGITIDSSNNITGVNNITSSLGTITTNNVQSNAGSNLNLLSSSGSNVNIDANNGKILLSTLDELRVQLIQNSSVSTNWIALCIRNGVNGQQMIVESIINVLGDIAYPSSLTNYMIVLPSNLSTSLLKKADFYYALSGLTGTAGAGVAISLVDQNNSTISGIAVTANGAGRISFGNNNNMNNTAYLNLNITFQTGVTGATLIIQSYALSIGI